MPSKTYTKKLYYPDSPHGYFLIELPSGEFTLLSPMNFNRWNDPTSLSDLDERFVSVENISFSIDYDIVDMSFGRGTIIDDVYQNAKGKQMVVAQICYKPKSATNETLFAMIDLDNLNFISEYGLFEHNKIPNNLVRIGELHVERMEEL